MKESLLRTPQYGCRTRCRSAWVEIIAKRLIEEIEGYRPGVFCDRPSPAAPTAPLL
jgi:hypothetical protein